MTKSMANKHDANATLKVEENTLPLEHHEHTNVSQSEVERESTQSLLECTAALLKHHQKNYSITAIQDMNSNDKGQLDPGSAVKILQNCGFEASFGAFSIADLHRSMLPAIGFTRDNHAILIADIEESGDLVLSPGQTNKLDRISKDDITETTQNYILLAKNTNNLKKNKNEWFWSSYLQSKSLYAQVLLAAMLTNFLGLTSSLFIMVVYDRVVPNQAVESLIALTVGVLIALSFDFVLKTLRSQFVDRAGKEADSRMTTIIFDKLLSSRVDKRRQNAGAMASIVREFDTLREFFTSATLIAIVDLPFVLFFIYVIYLISGPLAIIPALAVPVVILAGLIIQPFLSRISKDAMQTGMSKQAVLVEALNGMETIQATGAGKLMRRRFELASDEQSSLNFRGRALSQLAINSSASIQQLAQIATVFYGVFLIQDGSITSGALIAAMILGGRTLSPLSQLASAMTRANSALQAYRSLDKVMNDTDPNDISNNSSRLSRPSLSGTIELDNVSYTFDGAKAPLLKNITLKIPAGQKVAVLGRMGSGKSTLLRLLSGLSQPTSGSVLIDGVDMRQIDRSDLRRNVGVMLQETWLFSGSVKENLQMGFFEYDDDHILEIAKVSGADAFISPHPEGYDMQIRERGEGLSGGQRQSINLARALLHSPSTLILDEPTSAMDTSTEKVVIENLSSYLQNRTVIMVTHRNTLLDLVDRVLVMDKGAIIADTTPDELRKSAN